MTSNITQTLLHKLNTHSATVAVIGLGYVGLPLAVAFAESGFPVVGIDVNTGKVGAINQGRSYIEDVPSERVAQLTSNGKLSATTDFSVLARCDAAIICVPTPLNKTRDPDVRYLIAAGEAVSKHVHPGMLVGAGVHDLSRHYGGVVAADAGRRFRVESW